MAKKGMKRPQIKKAPPQNTQPPVPEIQGKAKHSKTPANPIIAGTAAPAQKVYHTTPFSSTGRNMNISSVYDNDLALDNLNNDTTVADLQDQ